MQQEGTYFKAPAEIFLPVRAETEEESVVKGSADTTDSTASQPTLSCTLLAGVCVWLRVCVCVVECECRQHKSP